jgi:chromate transporter
MLLELFKVFLRIGGLTIGGGLAMLPLIQAEIVNRKKWLTENEFFDMVCLTQSFPGVIAVNMAIMTGYRLAGIPGMLVSAIGVIIIPFLAILLIAVYLFRYIQSPGITSFMKGAMAGVLAVITGVILKLALRITRDTGSILLALIFLALSLLGIKVIYIIILAISTGLLGYYVPFIGARLGLESVYPDIDTGSGGEEL